MKFSLTGEDLQTFLDVIDTEHLLKQFSNHRIRNDFPSGAGRTSVISIEFRLMARLNRSLE